MGKRQVFLLGTDISDKIISIPDTVATAGDFGQLTINDLPSIEGDNRNRFWDKRNQASPFYGASQLSKFDIEIVNEGLVTYVGVIQGIQANNQSKTATITLKSDIQSKLEKGLVYDSDSESNPAQMVKEICSLYKIQTDSISFGRASSVYELDLVHVSGKFRNIGTVQDGIQQIIEVGLGRVYIANNCLYYDVFQPRTTDPMFTASDKVDSANGITLFSHPQTTAIEKEPISGYNVQFVGGLGGSAATYGSSENQGKSIDGSTNSPVRILTLQAATWIGEKWMQYFALQQEQVAFSVPAKYGKTFAINNPIGIEYRGSSYTVDLISVNNSFKVASELVGVSR
jgi:hypothetical protein